MNDISIGNLPPTTADFLPQYKAIGQSLKKRFFRKPNVAEAIEQYETLGQELQREEQKTFAAVCYLEAAKCQDTLRNHVPQANSLVKAGKLFLGAWEAEKHFTDASSGDDLSDATHLFGNLELGIQTLSQAAKSFNGQGYKGSAILINLQLGDILFSNGSYGEALNYYKIALLEAKQNFSFCDQLFVTELVCKAKVKMMEFESVLKTVNDALVAIKNHHEHEMDLPIQLMSSFIQKFEIMKIILVLILGVNTTDIVDFIWPKLSSATAETDGDDMSCASTESTNKESHERREVTYLLKSLALAVQESSSQELKQIHNKLIPFMDEIHHELMRFLVQMQC